jgi:hypothetical protein
VAGGGERERKKGDSKRKMFLSTFDKKAKHEKKGEKFLITSPR